MTKQQFEDLYGTLPMKRKVLMTCDCGKQKEIIKEKAIENINKHDGNYVCRSCAMMQAHKDRPCTPETAEKLRQGRLGKTHSEETKQKMACSANEKWQSEEGKILKKNLSIKAAKQHSCQDLNKSKRKILYNSNKNKNIVVCQSSYEFIACEDFLEKDDSVLSYKSQCFYEINNKGRSLDFVLQMTDGTTKVIEVKPLKRLLEDPIKEQLADIASYCNLQGWKLEIWTEKELNITSSIQATNRADAYRLENSNLDYAEYRKQKNREKAKRHYDKMDTLTFFCDYCQEDHTVLERTHDKNVARNGRYICEAEGGHIAGSKPKISLRKVNPYAAEGKKQCNKCTEVLLFENFDKDASRPDGHHNVCKKCRSINSTYQKKGPRDFSKDERSIKVQERIATGKKVCTKCKEEKPFSEFQKQSDKPDGYKSLCKKCVRLRNEKAKSD